MRNKTKGVIAGVAGLALLSGGVTYSLWSDTATVTGGTITNGNLDVAAIGPLAWVDVSPDRADSPHPITSLATWRMVPGDIIEGTQGIGVALEGDNLVATLEVSSATDPATFPTGISVTYDVLQGVTPIASDVPLGTATTMRLAAGRAGQGAGAPVNAPPTVVITDIVVPATPNLTVVLRATFDPATTGQVSVQATTVLGDVAVSLDQVRTGTDFVVVP